MLTHNIIVVEEPRPVYQNYGSYPYYDDTAAQQRYLDRYRGKYQYAGYVSSLYIKKGDYLVPRGNVTYPYPHDAYLRVADIQEIHTLVEFDPVTGYPLCLWCINKEGNGKWMHQDQVTRVYIDPPDNAKIKMPGE